MEPPSLPPLPMPPARPPWAPRLIVAGVALLLFAIACALPSVYLGNGDTWQGWSTLLFGWIGVLLGQVGWLANFPLLAAGIFLLCRWWRTCAVLALVAVLIGLDTFAMIGQEIPLDEGGVNKAFVTGLGPGVYVWLASMAALGMGAIVLRLRK